MILKRNMHAVDFIAHRQAGLLGKKSPNRATSQLNTDSWIRRFTCTRSNSYIVPGNFCDVPPFACKFAKDTNILAVATEEGEILLLNGSSMSTSDDNLLLRGWSAHKNAIFDICWVPDRLQLLSGSGDHTVALHDVRTTEKISIFMKHSGTIKSLDSCPTQPAVFASGSRDGAVIVWDMRVGGLCSAGHNDRPEIVINDAHCQTSCGDCGPSSSLKKKKRISLSCQLRSVTAVTFQDEFNLASAGVSDATVKIWDLRKTYIVSNKTVPVPKQLFHLGEKKLQHGCTSLRFDSTRNYLFACCTDSTISKFDCRSNSSYATSRYHGFKASSYFVKLCISPDDQYIVCGSGDENAHIWKISQPGLPLVDLSGHSAEVTAVDWHPTDFSKLATCGDDNFVFLWNIVGQDKDLSDLEYLGIPRNHAPEIRESEYEADYDTSASPSTSPSHLVKLRERSLREFFSSPTSVNASKSSRRNEIQSKAKFQNNPKSAGILQSVTNVLITPNRKRKMVENETENNVSFANSSNENQRIRENSVSPKHSRIASLEDSSDNGNNEDKENGGNHNFSPKATSARSPLGPKDVSYHENNRNSPTSKKLCLTTPGKSPSSRRRTPKSKKQETKLITNYFHRQ